MNKEQYLGYICGNIR